MEQALPWIIALAVLVVAAAALALWATRPRLGANLPLPTEWAVEPRTVFTIDERRAFRHLREAFAGYAVLAKLPLIRFCQPADPAQMRYWFELLGSAHVSFAVCSLQGRVLAAIDLESGPPAARRTQQIKQSVLSACRVRYLRCARDQLPSISELQQLLPAPAGQAGGAATGASINQQAARAPGAAASPQQAPHHAQAPTRAQQPAAAMGQATSERSALPKASTATKAETPAARSWRDRLPLRMGERSEAAADPQARSRKPLWQDSGLFQDSFFGIENLRDAGPQSGFGEVLDDIAHPRNPAGATGPSTHTTTGVLESGRATSSPRKLR
jgi:hypothetical protein